jgi:coenzyme F420-reducing hydrogenase delta subunit
MACVRVCPTHAIVVDALPELDTIACIGCGACVSECPTKVFDLAHYTDGQLDATTRGLLADEGDDIRILGFFGDVLSYVAADSAGTARMEYSPSTRILRVPSAARVARSEILRAFAYGADGVILSDEENGEMARIAEERLKSMGEELDSLGIGRGRVVFIPMLLPIYKVLPKLIDNFDKKVGLLGRLPDDVRSRALEASRETKPPVFADD